MRFPARIFAVLIAFVLVFFTTKVAFAANAITQPINLPAINSSTNANVPQTTHFWAQTVMLEVMSAMTCQLAGIDPINPKRNCLGSDQKTGQIGFVGKGGAIGVASTLIASTLFVPVHFSDYATYAVNNFGLAKNTYAQTTGIGFSSLSPVFDLFTKFRNMAYILFVFIFVAVGMAIMLRVHIDPRTVMTIQNQIPKLVIGLVMITFSYAIAGLLIDAMWVGTYFAINTITPKGVTAADFAPNVTLTPLGFVNNVWNGTNNTSGGIWGLSFDAGSGVGAIIRDSIHSDELAQTSGSDCSNKDFFSGVACNVGNFISGTITSLLSVVFSWIIGFIAGILAILIFLIAIFVQLLKLWFALLKSFITVLLDVILAPFWILAGLLPGVGSKFGFTSWLRDLFANLIVFPTVVFIFLVAKQVSDAFALGSGSTANFFAPPLVGNPLSAAKGFGALIAVGFILSAPGIVEQVKKALGAGGGFSLGGVGTGMAAAGVVGGAIGSRLYHKRSDGTHGGALAVAGRSFGTRASNSRLGQRLGKFTDKGIGGVIKRNTNEAYAGMAPHERGLIKQHQNAGMTSKEAIAFQQQTRHMTPDEQARVRKWTTSGADKDDPLDPKESDNPEFKHNTPVSVHVAVSEMNKRRDSIEAAKNNEGLAEAIVGKMEKAGIKPTEGPTVDTDSGAPKP